MFAAEANRAVRWVSRRIEAWLQNGRPWQSLRSDESPPSRGMQTIAWLAGISDVGSQPYSGDFAVASTRVDFFPAGKSLSTGEGTIAVASPHGDRPFPSHPLSAIYAWPRPFVRHRRLQGSADASLESAPPDDGTRKARERWCVNQASGDDAARRRRSITATPSPSSATPSTMITSTPCASSFRKAAKR